MLVVQIGAQRGKVANLGCEAPFKGGSFKGLKDFEGLKGGRRGAERGGAKEEALEAFKELQRL